MLRVVIACPVQGAAQLLLRFGAIHTCPVPPALPQAVLEAMPQDEAAATQRRRQVAIERYGRSVRADPP